MMEEDDEYGETVYDPHQNQKEAQKTRKKYRSLIRDIEENQREYADPNNDNAMNVLVEATEMFGNVHQPREAVMDGQLVLSLASIGHSKMTTLKSTFQEFNEESFKRHLKNFRTRRNQKVDWALIGRKAMAFDEPLPQFSTMFGPLDLDLTRKPRQQVTQQKKKWDANKAVAPVTSKDSVKDDKDEAAERIREVSDCLNEALEEVDTVNFFKFVVNPKSFGQTVENIFHLSFMVRDGDVSVALDENGLPTLVALLFLGYFLASSFPLLRVWT
eukprot:m.47503 g.47503  ORF g.47503 m.47503 type:complete len:272 (-) comp7335_c1_seq1:33-848(-)